MSLLWIDVSHWKAGLQIARTDAQAVGIKLTEGASYRDPAASDFVRQTRNAGRLMLAYHFHNAGVSTNAELNNFLDRCHELDLIGEAILCLDWEDSDKANVGLAKQWLDALTQRTNQTPWLYISQSNAHENNWSTVAVRYPLWVSRYNTELGPTGAWPNPIAWQYTDRHATAGYEVDASHFYGTKTDWLAYASGSIPRPDPAPDTGTTGVLPMSKLTTYRRRDDLTVPLGDWKNVNLVNEDAEAKQFAVFTGPGAYYAVANIQPQHGGCWAQFFIADKDDKGADEVSHETKVWIPQDGGQICSYGNLGDAKTKGAHRQLRLRVQAEAKGVVLNDIATRVGTE